jgi:xylan 1,4-beta-xylosidase
MVSSLSLTQLDSHCIYTKQLQSFLVRGNMLRRLIFFAIFLVALSVVSTADSSRTIQADLETVKAPRSLIWQDCVGAGRIGEGLRDGRRRQLELCHRELGFKYLRAHGLLHDELDVYSEDADGNPRYNWQYIDDIYDFLLDTGMRPFVEFSFMPNDLASGDRTIFWWKANVSTPSDYNKWDALITALVQHWTDRYGVEEVKKWRFEVLNEPQLSIFFQPPQGKPPRDAYLELYEYAAKAICSVNSDYIVGGPAGPGWFKELIDLRIQKDLLLGFISFHCYGLDGGPTGLDETGENLLYLSNDLNAPRREASRYIQTIKHSAKPDLPIYITEWSSCYSSRDPIHDTYFEAPYILQQLRNTEEMGSMSYWTFTDIFEENGPGWRPFHGGFALINYQGIKKSAYWAYRCLAQLGPTEITSSDPASYVCKDDRGGYQILFWDLTHPIQGRVNGPVSDQEFFVKPLIAKEKDPVSVKLTNITAGKYKLTIYRIGYQHNDPYSKYLEMGRPTDLTREDVANLKALSSGKPTSESVVTVDDEFSTTLPMLENSVYLLRLTPEAKK